MGDHCDFEVEWFPGDWDINRHRLMAANRRRAARLKKAQGAGAMGRIVARLVEYHGCAASADEVAAALEAVQERKRRIVLEFDKGRTMASIAADFGISKQRVGQIVRHVLRDLSCGPLRRPVVIELSAEDQARFAEALIDPPAPNARLRAAAARRKMVL